MASLSQGMNIEEVETAGRQLQERHAEAIRDTVRQMEAIVGRSPGQWIGTDADRFRSWWPSKRSAMLAMADDLHGFGQSALNNAAEQRQASGTGGMAAVRPGHQARMVVELHDGFPALLDLARYVKDLKELPENLLLFEDLYKWQKYLGGQLPTTFWSDIDWSVIDKGSVVLDSMEIAYHLNEYGLGDARTWESMVAGTGSVIGVVVPGGDKALSGGMFVGGLIADSSIGQNLQDSTFSEFSSGYDLTDPTSLAQMNSDMQNPVNLAIAMGKAIWPF